MAFTEFAAKPHGIDAASLHALPHSPGVYIFRGEGALPLYIGKSVDIRSRVLSHLRAEDEAEMMAQSRRVDCIETAGEIGALLLEAWLIKQQSPLFNIRLRRLRNLYAIRLVNQGGAVTPEWVSGRDVAIGKTSHLYGLFSSVHAAQSKLKALADQHRLCLGLLGLEKMSKRGCFGLQVKTCLGACIGQEDRRHHDERLVAALADVQIQVWPFPGAVDLVEQRGDWIQRHRIQDWHYQGTWCSRALQFEDRGSAHFDLDTYKILVKPVMMGTVQMERV